MKRLSCFRIATFSTAVDRKVEEQYENEVEKFWKILLTFLNIIGLLANRCLTLRDHREIIHCETDDEPDSPGNRDTILKRNSSFVW